MYRILEKNMESTMLYRCNITVQVEGVELGCCQGFRVYCLIGNHTASDTTLQSEFLFLKDPHT